MKLEFVQLSSKTVAGDPRQKYKTESRWLVKEVLTFRSKVWEVLVEGHCEGTQFTLVIEPTLSTLLPKHMATKMETEINDPQSSVSDFYFNMREHASNHGYRWSF